MPWPLEVLIVSANHYIRLHLTEMLAGERLNAVSCSTLSEAQIIMLRHPICLVFSDCRFSDGDIHGVLVAVRRSAASVPVIAVCRAGDWEQSVKALKTGALDYIECSWPRLELQRVVRHALSAVSLFAPEPPARGRLEFGEDL